MPPPDGPRDVGPRTALGQPAPIRPDAPEDGRPVTPGQPVDRFDRGQTPGSPLTNPHEESWWDSLPDWARYLVVGVPVAGAALGIGSAIGRLTRPRSPVQSEPTPVLSEAERYAQDQFRLPFENRDRRYILGRQESQPGSVIRLSNLPSDRERQFISSQHAELSLDHGAAEIRDLGSMNGTVIYRHNPATDSRIQIPVSDLFVELRDGDVVRFAQSYYELRITSGHIRFVRVPSINGSVQLQTLTEDVAQIAEERPLRERIERARSEARLVEVFHRTKKNKYVGTIVAIEQGSDGQSFVVLRQESNGQMRVPLDEVLTIRNRHGDNFDSRYSRVADPQLRDRSVNINGQYSILIDFEDPRLTEFLENRMTPIRNRLIAGEITEVEATREAWRIIRNYVPYDQVQLAQMRNHTMPRELYRLGDFIQTGVCNERGMLLQVSLQHIGVESRWSTGWWGGMHPDNYHAWVEVEARGPSGETIRLLVDPQNRRILFRDRASDSRGVQAYTLRQQHSHLMSRVMTMAIRGFSEEAERRLVAEGFSPRDIRAMQSEYMINGVDMFDWSQIREERRRTLLHRFRFNGLEGLGGESLSHAVMFQFVEDSGFTGLSELGQEAEIDAALRAYEGLTVEERNFMWEQSAGERHTNLPRYFIDRYIEIRRSFHERSIISYGEMAELDHSMLLELRQTMQSDGYRGFSPNMNTQVIEGINPDAPAPVRGDSTPEGRSRGPSEMTERALMEHFRGLDSRLGNSQYDPAMRQMARDAMSLWERLETTIDSSSLEARALRTAVVEHVIEEHVRQLEARGGRVFTRMGRRMNRGMERDREGRSSEFSEAIRRARESAIRHATHR